MTLADRLNKIISEQKITKREFASRLGVTENYIYILTTNSPSRENVNKKISNKLNNPITSFLNQYSFNKIHIPTYLYIYHYLNFNKFSLKCHQ